MLKSEEIKPIALVVIGLHLPKASQPASHFKPSVYSSSSWIAFSCVILPAVAPVSHQ